jgi:antitoxin HicB
MKYPVVLIKDHDGFVVTFPDFPEGITQGDTVEEALYMAEDCLKLIIETRLDFQEKIPEPLDIKNYKYFVEVEINS